MAFVSEMLAITRQQSNNQLQERNLIGDDVMVSPKLLPNRTTELLRSDNSFRIYHSNVIRKNENKNTKEKINLNKKESRVHPRVIKEKVNRDVILIG